MIVWRTGQIECLADDSSCHPFKNAGQESKAIFVVFETAKASVIVFLLGDKLNFCKEPKTCRNRVLSRFYIYLEREISDETYSFE